MKTRTFALLLMLAACDDEAAPRLSNATPRDAVTPDARKPSSPTSDADAGDANTGDMVARPPSHPLDARQGELAASLARWQELASENPGPYWYEDENCLINSDEQHSYITQVDQQGARRAGGRTVAACAWAVNRFGTIGGSGTFPGLHEICAALLTSRPDTKFSLDEQGVVQECWVGDDEDCFDNCGRGFALLSWGFGTAPSVDEGVPGDGG